MLATDLAVGRDYAQRTKSSDADCPLHKLTFISKLLAVPES